MKFIADFHIHSHYSIATSKDLVPELLAYYGGLKGLKVIGTGDFTHPGWTAELQEKLVSNGRGLFTLKEELRLPLAEEGRFDRDIHFILTAEVSMIYKKQGRVRKVHVVLFAPDFETVENIQRTLKAHNFNITSDGRPILGIDAKDLLDMLLSISEEIVMVPAHIWTPWFSILGDKSGFNTVRECFEDLTPHIHTVETGLSSDPQMNWLCSFLDEYTLISNSDAHSPDKLGRNANIFDTELSYRAIMEAMKTGDPHGFLGTIDLFPQEGKYHYDGHRKCGICWTPLDSEKHRNLCPVCGKKITVGVLNRVCSLADRDDPLLRPHRLPFYSIIPLKEILCELTGCGENSKKVKNLYNSLVTRAGSEFNLLLSMEPEKIKSISDEHLGEAIRRMRKGEVLIKPGYDGEFGKISLLGTNEHSTANDHSSLFAPDSLVPPEGPARKKIFHFDLAQYHLIKKENQELPAGPGEEGKDSKSRGPSASSGHKADREPENPEQEQAILHGKGPALIIAGPGTGKTRTLTYRILNLVETQLADPASILAVTFTNKAAQEMKTRLKQLMKQRPPSAWPQVCTFHSLGLAILRENALQWERRPDFMLINEEDKEYILKKMGLKKKVISVARDGISRIKQLLCTEVEIKDEYARSIFAAYEQLLVRENAFDLEDLIYRVVLLLQGNPEVREHYCRKYTWILVDEYQDINYAQYCLIRLLSGGAEANLCVIGDPDQAIYGFRGSDVGFIRKFREDYPGARLYSLQKSYRCSQQILNAGSSMLTGTKEGLIGLHQGVKTQICPHTTGPGEAEFIARTIEQMIGGVRFFSLDSDIADGHEHEKITSLSDFVILCRLKEQMKALQKACMDHGLPCRLYGETSFFAREPVRSILDILRLSLCPGNTFLKEKICEKNLLSLETKDINTVVSISSLQEKIEYIKERWFYEADPADLKEIGELCTLAGGFGGTIEDFLDYTALGTGSDLYDKEAECVSIMTLHSAKGLEFECVFISGCEEGLLPYGLFDSSAEKMPDVEQSDPRDWQVSRPGMMTRSRDEERRLLYVGMTRAKKYLFLTYAQQRILFNRNFSLKRSSFLDAIEEELFEINKTQYIRKREEQPGLFDRM